MKLTVERDAISDALKMASGVLPMRSIHPILSNVLISAVEGELSVLGTDQDMSLRADIKCDIISDGAVAAPAKSLTELIRVLAPGSLTMETDDTRVAITQGTGSFTISGVNPADFPSVDIMEQPKETIKLPAAFLNSLINSSSFAISKDSSRVSLSGLYIKITDGKAVAVGTDGGRLALTRAQLDGDESAEMELLVPIRTIEQLHKLIVAQKSEGDIEITTSEQAVQFKMANSYTLQSKLIAERFPNYEQVIPPDNDIIAVADKELLSEALERINVLTNPTSNLVRFGFSENKLVLTGQDFEMGTRGEESIAVDFKGENFAIGINARSLLEILGHCQGEEIRFAMKTPHSAAVVTPVPQPAGGEFMVVMMPLRLMEE